MKKEIKKQIIMPRRKKRKTTTVNRRRSKQGWDVVLEPEVRLKIKSVRL